MLTIGDHAPEVTLTDKDGLPVLLSSLTGNGPAVLFFYPKDDTPVCTAEVCTFRDHYTEFIGLGATVIGISDDGPASHQRFAADHELPFLLLSDVDGAARKAFRLETVLGFKARATFVIDGQGIIRSVVSDRLNARRHVRKALAALREQRPLP